MITVNDAEHILERLSAQSIAVDQTRCVCVRNRNASCKACTIVCPTHALTIENNHLAINPDACIQCGSCANICPTQALTSSAAPHDAWLSWAHEKTQGTPPSQNTTSLENKLTEYHTHLAFSHQTEDKKTNALWVCCQEHPLAKENLTHLMVLPCLAHIDEVHYLVMAHYGVSLHLLHNKCEACNKKTVLPLIKSTFRSAQTLANRYNITFTCDLTEETTKADSCYPLSYDKGGYSRRSFFGSMGESFKKLGFTVAETAVEPAFKTQNKQPTLAQQLTQAPGKLKVFMPYRNTVLLNLLYEAQEALPLKRDFNFKTRFWGKVAIDNTCRNCSICARFCPTGALVHCQEKPSLGTQSFTFNKLQRSNSLNQHSEPLGPNHEFRCSDCIQCKLCEDICLANALHVQDDISNLDLFNLEPVRLKHHDEDN